MLSDIEPEEMPDSKYPEDWDTIRKQVYARDKYRCANCRRDNVQLHCHHIVPIAKGGCHGKHNLKTLCRECHMAIHDNRPFAPTHEFYSGDTSGVQE